VNFGKSCWSDGLRNIKRGAGILEGRRACRQRNGRKHVCKLPATPNATTATKAHELSSNAASRATALGSCHRTFMLLPMLAGSLPSAHLRRRFGHLSEG
jgi:hypothetical protein